MNEKKKTKNITKKAKKIRSIVMMSLLCILMLSAATYAWFTLSNTAKVANLTMTVGDTSGLQIAEDNNGSAGTFGGSITFPAIKGKLLPATTTDGKNFKEPEYNDEGEVYNLKTASKKLPQTDATDDTEGYYIEYSFWLKSLGDQDSTIKLAKGEGISDGIYIETYKDDYKGTYVLSKSVDTSKSVPGSAAVRISFVGTNKDNTEQVTVFEPNSDITNDGITLTKKEDYAVDSTTDSAKAADVKHKESGEIDTTADGDVITLKANTPTKITMYIWIEGKDAQCVNQIAAKDIIGQLLFTNAAD